MNPNQLLSTVSSLGRMLLESGAEVYRVEETMVKIAQSFNVEHVESFVTPTVVMLSVTYEGQVYSNLIRIKHRNTDLNRIDQINTLSRSLWTNPRTLDELQEEIKEISKGDEYPFSRKLFFAGVAAFGFAFLFNGAIKEAILSFVIGFCTKFVSYKFDSLGVKGFLNSCISSGFVMLSTLIALYFIPFDMNLDTVVISSLMLLVPGLEFTNAIRDTLAGDYLSGMSRATEAILVAVALAVGCGVVLSAWVGHFGGVF